MDYRFLTQDGGFSKEATSNALTVLVAVDRDSSACMAVVAKQKGGKDEPTVRLLARWIELLGHRKYHLHGDNEPAMLDLIRAVKKNTAADTVPRTGVPYSSQSQAQGEEVHQEIAGQFRAMKAWLEKKLGCVLTPGMAIVEWMIRHAAWTRTRFGGKGSDGAIPFFRLNGCHYTGMVCYPGESVMARITMSKQKGRKFASRWQKSVW